MSIVDVSPDWVIQIGIPNNNDINWRTVTKEKALRGNFAYTRIVLKKDADLLNMRRLKELEVEHEERLAEERAYYRATWWTVEKTNARNAIVKDGKDGKDNSAFFKYILAAIVKCPHMFYVMCSTYNMYAIVDTPYGVQFWNIVPWNVLLWKEIMTIVEAFHKANLIKRKCESIALTMQYCDLIMEMMDVGTTTTTTTTRYEAIQKRVNNIYHLKIWGRTDDRIWMGKFSDFIKIPDDDEIFKVLNPGEECMWRGA